MIGRRLPVVDGKPTWPCLEGDYCGPVTGYTGDRPAVFYLLPGAGGRGLRHVTSPPHTFRECSDGSLEIRASILHQDGDGWSWHGYLDEGNNWRVV